MGFPLLSKLALNAKKYHKLHSVIKHDYGSDVPKGQMAMYVEETETKKTRFVIPITYLNHPSFQVLLRRSEEVYGYNHPMAGLRIPCEEHVFISLISLLKSVA